MTKEELQETHKTLIRAKYQYYEKHNSIMTDYEFDILEKEYDKYCIILDAPEERRLINFIGFDWKMPFTLFEFFGEKTLKRRDKTVKKPLNK